MTRIIDGIPTRCEDAPCCGCCGTDLYGNNNEDHDPRSDEEIKQAVYDRYNDPDYDFDHDEDY